MRRFTAKLLLSFSLLVGSESIAPIQISYKDSVMTKKQITFSKDVAKLIVFANSLGIDMTFGEVFRTNEQQEIYLKSGRTNARYSQHQNRLAVDFNFFIDGELTYKKSDLQVLGNYWETLRSVNVWGGNFKSFIDTPHFTIKD